jgi:PIN domain nuclease of toxin-antitoxin system
VSAERAGLLLDTNAMLWLLAGDERLSSRARATLRDAGRSLVVSAVSLWEVAIKRSSGKLRAPADLSRRLAALRQVELLPISPLHAEALGRLPPRSDDIFVRMLATQALVERLRLISANRAFTEYGVDVIW